MGIKIYTYGYKIYTHVLGGYKKPNINQFLYIYGDQPRFPIVFFSINLSVPYLLTVKCKIYIYIYMILIMKKI